MDEELILWKNDYDTGIEQIDSQHQELLDIVNRLLLASEEFKTVDTERFLIWVMPGIKALEDHFSTEEKWMEEKNYIKLTEHKQKHDRMLIDLKEILDEVQSGKRKPELLTLALYVREWFIKHIYEQDIPMGEAFK